MNRNEVVWSVLREIDTFGVNVEFNIDTLTTATRITFNMQFQDKERYLTSLKRLAALTLLAIERESNDEQRS